MGYDMKECGKRIHQLRKRSGYTQEELAGKLNMDRSVLSRIEAGKYACTVDFLTQVSNFFDISLDYLVFGSIQKKNTAQLKANITELICYLEHFKEEI